MSWKKGCLLAAVAGVLLAAVIVAIVFWATSGAVEAGDAFLARIGEGDLAAAYRATAPAFQAQQDEASFREVVARLGLTEFASASWSQRSIEGSRAELEGTFTTRAGDELPLQMSLVKAGGEWRVFSLSGRQAGAAVVPPGETEPGPGAPRVPVASELERLAAESVLALNASIVARDFSSFHGYVSELWQGQTSAEELAGAFQAFVDNEIDMSGIGDVAPVFEGDPLIDSDGVLNLAGHFPTTPAWVTFRLRYLREAGEWKLLGIQVDLVEPRA